MEVKCIDDVFNSKQKELIPNRPVKDEHYIIRDYSTLPNGQKAVWLMEIENPELPHPSGLGTYEPSFNIKRFTDIEGNPLDWNKVKQSERNPQLEYVYVGVEKEEKKETFKKYWVY